MQEIVTVIVPVYNAEKYIEACIQSVEAQSMESWELILVDDGSTDSSYDICQNYANKNKRIRVIRQENSGVSVARNTGIQVATGKYITFIDSDDYIMSNHLQVLYSRMREDCCELAISNICLDCMGKKRNNIWLKGERTYSKQDYMKYVRDIFPNVSVGSVCNKLFCAEIIRENELLFDVDCNHSEDYFYNIKYLSFCHKIGISDEATYFYRLTGEESLSKSQTDFVTAIRRWESVYFAFCTNEAEMSGSRGYVRAMVDCISEEVKRGSSIRTIKKTLKEHFEETGYFKYIKEAKRIKEYPYNIAGFFLKKKAYGIVAKLFKTVQTLRKR
ncbi:MAG: glycosyltransferase [Lachnospiraceae bacterium]|nr:glycosyltransferase [Lachnospiraceae bacterium]